MSLRRSVCFLLTRRFSAWATPRTAPAGSLRSLRDFPVADGIGRATGVAAAALASSAALALLYSRKDTADDEASPQQEEDMKARFEYWVKKYDITYRDEEEKAMRFNVFKDNIKALLPINCFADLKDEELPSRRSCIGDIGQDSEECRQTKILAEKGEFRWTPDQP
ncbi:hypothetical protein QYE76_060900 [Lolium multiflorum]|uniref:Cathepsin propeptide inhibitor domain-containing protein n=1 Tax=Lolium multiflorum TaxID=4521 RepID=A0AAD8S277_LOLMU|nr:hypothetical protein QYE76_060900 [Lolium multiflorum]